MNNKKDRNNNNQKKSWKMSKIFRKQAEKNKLKTKNANYIYRKMLTAFRKRNITFFIK